MSATVIDGRRAAAAVLRRVAKQKPRRRLTLAAVIVGQRADSLQYIHRKEIAAKHVGVRTLRVALPATASQLTLNRTLRRLSDRTDITGILLQLPLPSHLETDLAISYIDQSKDVDGLRPASPFLSPFAQAILTCVRLGQPRGRVAIILARRSIFSERLFAELAKKGFRTTIQPATKKIPPLTKQANVVITLLGRGPRVMINNIKRQSVVIDGGIRQRNGQTIGDVDLSVRSIAKAVSPVPGGVGPLTVAYLLKNVCQKK